MTPEEWEALDRKIHAWERWRREKDEKARAEERKRIVEEATKRAE